MKNFLGPILFFTAFSLLPTGATALTTSLQFTIQLEGDAERRLVKYECENRTEILIVEYLDAAPNFLAILPVKNKKLIFANIYSKEGTSYISGKYAWRIKGVNTNLLDLTAAEADRTLLACAEVNDSA